jgi:hypothetical protein
MKLDVLSATLLVTTALLSVALPAIAIDEIAERKMVSRGGILYPHVGDAMQDRFQTPANIKDLVQPGMLIGVLPDDCKPASSGVVGAYYRCNYGFDLQAEEYDGKTVYRVIEAP